MTETTTEGEIRDGVLLKFLREDGLSPVSLQPWDLPVAGAPGEWMPAVKDPRMCERGYHFSTVNGVAEHMDACLYVGEGANPPPSWAPVSGDKMVFGRGRLLRRVEAWDSMAMRRFALDQVARLLAAPSRAAYGLGPLVDGLTERLDQGDREAVAAYYTEVVWPVVVREEDNPDLTDAVVAFRTLRKILVDQRPGVPGNGVRSLNIWISSATARLWCHGADSVGGGGVDPSRFLRVFMCEMAFQKQRFLWYANGCPPLSPSSPLPQEAGRTL